MDYRLRSTRLDQMAADPDPQVRRTVANHTRTGVGAMALLLNDSKRGVRFEAALTTLGTGWTWGQHNGILSLANGSRLRIRVSRVTDMLRCLVEDPCKKVRLLLAGHTCTPAGILGWLVDDRDAEVRGTILKRDTFPRDELVRLNGLHPNRYFSAGTITLTQRALKKLSDSSNAFTRGMVARNCRTSAAVLRRLSGDKSEFVRSKLIENPKYMRMSRIKAGGGCK